MASRITLEQIEKLVFQLPPGEQLKLLARIGERLSRIVWPETDEERWRREYAARVDAFLKMSDELAAETIGRVDSAEDIRRIREERMSRL